MADDIWTRLMTTRDHWVRTGEVADFACWRDAADEIERLRQQVDSLSKQLDQAVSRD